MHWMVATGIVLALLAPASIVQAQPDHKQVLVLYSTRRDAQFSVVGEAVLPRALDVGLERNLDYYAEFIDSARFPERGYQRAVSEFLRVKYQGIRFDLVIAMHDAALEFVNNHGDPLFGDTPVVFLANSPALRRRRNSTGLIHERNLAGTIGLIRQLQPDVQEVFVVTGRAPADEQFGNTLRRQLASSDSVLKVTYLSGLATKELESRLSTLPPRAAVYYLLVTEDGAGNKFHPLEYVDRVAAAANAPTYSWVDSAMGHGVVGGRLYVQSDAIEGVGQLGLRVLRGEPADRIAIAAPDLNASRVDWRQLRRWRIDEARVPPGTVVEFRESTIWDRYRHYILGALTLLISQTVLIAGLLVQRQRRRRAEDELRASQDDLRTSFERNRDISARLLKAQETERSRIAGELHDDVCQRMLLLTIELEALGRTNRDQGHASEALTVARDISRSLHDLSHRLHPAGLRMIGLVAGLDRLCVEVSHAGIVAPFTHDRVPASLAPDVMLCLFRVAQEALQNAVKYSSAGQISVRLTGGTDGLTLTVVDDGVGFVVDSAWRNGVGLASMVERMEAIGGSLEIRSRAGKGTAITAHIRAEVLHTETDRGAGPPTHVTHTPPPATNASAGGAYT
jgi:signal transduction histidine kinase